MRCARPAAVAASISLACRRCITCTEARAPGVVQDGTRSREIAWEVLQRSLGRGVHEMSARSREVSARLHELVVDRGRVLALLAHPQQKGRGLCTPLLARLLLLLLRLLLLLLRSC